MPIVTPAYPAMNSAANVNPWSFAVLREEFGRASECCKTIVAKHAELNGAHDGAAPPDLCAPLWEHLIEKTDFFDKYDASPFFAASPAVGRVGRSRVFGVASAATSGRVRESFLLPQVPGDQRAGGRGAGGL